MALEPESDPTAPRARSSRLTMPSKRALRATTASSLWRRADWICLAQMGSASETKVSRTWSSGENASSPSISAGLEFINWSPCSSSHPYCDAMHRAYRPAGGVLESIGAPHVATGMEFTQALFLMQLNALPREAGFSGSL